MNGLYDLKKYLGKTILALGLYNFFWGGFELASILSPTRITSQSQLEQAVEAEKISLGCDRTISSMFVDDAYFLGRAEKVANSYKIFLDPDTANLSILRHEVYHVCRTEMPCSPFRYWFLEEPAAIIYGLFKISF